MIGGRLDGACGSAAFHPEHGLVFCDIERPCDPPGHTTWLHRPGGYSTRYWTWGNLDG